MWKYLLKRFLLMFPTLLGVAVLLATLRRAPRTLPETLPFGDAVIKPLRGGETLNWTLS